MRRKGFNKNTLSNSVLMKLFSHTLFQYLQGENVTVVKVRGKIE